MIEIGGNITIGNGILIGDYPVIIGIGYFVTEDNNNLVSESNDDFVAE